METCEPETIEAVCEVLSDPDDGRDKGRSALAERLDVSPKAVQKWIAGERKCRGPAAMMVREIADDNGVLEDA